MAQRRGRLPAFRRGPQRRPKRGSKMARKGPRGPQLGPWEPSDGPQGLQGGLQTTQRSPRDGLRKRQTAQECPQTDKRPPRSLRGAPKALPRCRKRPRRKPKGDPRAFKSCRMHVYLRRDDATGHFFLWPYPPGAVPPGDFCETSRKSLPPGSPQPPATPLGRVSRGCARLHTGPWEGPTGPMSAPRGP